MVGCFYSKQGSKEEEVAGAFFISGSFLGVRFYSREKIASWGEKMISEWGFSSMNNDIMRS